MSDPPVRGDAATGDEAVPPIERLVELAVFGPLELTAKVVERVPPTVAQARQQLVLARFIGKMAVDQGVREVRRRLEADLANGGRGPAESGDGPDRATETDQIEPEPTPAPEDDHSEPALRARVLDADELALPDYAQLPASHIVAKLAGLTQDERDSIETYERANRHRRTVLGKLDQLREVADS